MINHVTQYPNNKSEIGMLTRYSVNNNNNLRDIHSWQQQQQHRIPYPESVCLLYTYKTNKLHSQLDAAINDATKLWWC